MLRQDIGFVILLKIIYFNKYPYWYISLFVLMVSIVPIFYGYSILMMFLLLAITVKFSITVQIFIDPFLFTCWLSFMSFV